jgi:elongation of very long chain fatty acids protein 6
MFISVPWQVLYEVRMLWLPFKRSSFLNTNSYILLHFTYYKRYEKYYDPIPVLDWMSSRPIVPIAAVLAYGLLIIWGRKTMEHKEPWKWRKYLAAWNFFLSLFSWIGAFRTAPQLIHNLMTMSFHENLCNDPQVTYGSGSSGLWVQLFILSKFPELLDTFFIVIHKKPLIFLHWYHHITVLAYCWHSYVSKSPAGLFFVVMNYSVHAIMYGYYFLMAIHMKPKWLNAMFITTAQISQMVVGVGITIAAFYFYKNDPDCMIHKENNIAAFLMYGSYLFLFAQFFLTRYFRKATPAKKKTE